VTRLDPPPPRRKWQPRSFRQRFTLLFASLFLVGGSLLIIATYEMVVHNIPAGTSYKPPAGSLLTVCEHLAKSQLPIGSTCQSALLAASKQGSQNQRSRDLSALIFFSLIGLAVMEALAVLAGWLLSGRILRPVHSITEAARTASEENLGARLSLEGPDDELKELADTFDEMIDRLDRAFTSQKMFVANASHELRTPLTAMRTAVDVTLANDSRSPEDLEKMGEKVRDYVDQSDRIIEALLTLSISQQELAKDDVVDLATSVEDALDARTKAIASRRIHLDLRLERSLVLGHRILLERLVENLVDNAIHHNIDDGRIQIITRSIRGSTLLTISNSGPIIPESLLPSLFEPFRRLDTRKIADGGAGLGLAIVQSIANGHSATLRVVSQANGGLKAEVVFVRKFDAQNEMH